MHDYYEIPDVDGDGEELFEDTQIIATEECECCECNTTIQVGKLYRNITGCWGGDWNGYSMCTTCVTLSERFQTETEGDHHFGGLYEELFNCGIVDKVDGKYIVTESWLKITNQKPLKLEAV